MELLTKDDFFNELEQYIVQLSDNELYDVESIINDFIDIIVYDFEYQVFLLDYYDYLLNEKMQLQHYNNIESLFHDVLFDIIMEYLNEHNIIKDCIFYRAVSEFLYDS